MIKKVYYIVKSQMHYYPPCVSQIRMLHDLGVEVVAVYGSSDGEILRKFDKLGIKTLRLCDPRGKYRGKLDKINNWLSFRKELKKLIKKQSSDETLFWFGNAETLLPMLGRLKHIQYVITYLELLDHMPMRLFFLKQLSQNAKAVITCEETRSYLMKYWFDLKKLPYTMPNKPYCVEMGKNTTPTTEKGRYVMNIVKNNRFVIYQGIFQNDEYLEVVAKVMRDCYPNYYFVMMGIDKRNVADKICQINPKTVCIEYIPAPLHLEVTSNAYIGLLFYEPDSLNKAFCAPNKIFEYSYFGLPIIGNDIPGLKNTIGCANVGVCTELSYEKVKEAFAKIETDYNYYSNNAYEFYKSVDNLGTMKKIAKDIGMSF